MLETQTQNLSVARSSSLVSKSPVFYGWIIVAVGTLGLIMTSPGQTYSVSIFIEHFIENLGISRSLVSTLYTVGTLVGSFALPMVGRQIDRRGSRLMVVIITTIFGLACVYMGFVRNTVMLGLGFVAIRMFGQGGLQLVSVNVINQWWARRRGMVMGISGLLTMLLGIGCFPSLINWLIPIYGWRFTYVQLGLMILFVMMPLGLIFFRNQPEDYGLQPDGSKPPSVDGDAATVELMEENWTLMEAIRTPVFWIMAAGIALIAMLSTGLHFHMVSICQDNDLTPTVAAAIYVPLALTSAIVNLGGGVLVDRIPVRVLLATALAFQAISLLMAQFLTGVELAFVYGVILGATLGLQILVHNVIWAMYFGRRHLGSITGTTTTIMSIGSALGPMPLGIARGLLGNYNLALTVFAVSPLVLGFVTLFVDRPQKR
jgi:MFS family permease